MSHGARPNARVEAGSFCYRVPTDVGCYGSELIAASS